MGMKQGLDYDKLLIKTDPIVKTIAIELELFHGGDQVFPRNCISSLPASSINCNKLF